MNQNGHGDRDAESCLVLEYDVQSVNDTRDPTQDGQTDIDEEISTASPLKENTQGREDDREEDLADIRSSERHGDEGVSTRNL